MGDLDSGKEYAVRDGLPNFFGKASKGEEITVAFLGGSITQAEHCYRLQLCDYIQNRWPEADFQWINAGVSGTGTDLGAFRTQEHILQHNPDLVFIDFAVNGAYAAGIEGIVRKIRHHNPDTDICFLYAAKESYLSGYSKGDQPAEIAALEKVAEYYSIPSVHLAVEAVRLQKEGKLIWKGDKADGRILFSNDGLHPLQEGGDLYASAIAKALEAMGGTTKAMPGAPKAHICPAKPLVSDIWENAEMYVPSEIAKYDGNWKAVETVADGNLKPFSGWFDNVLVSKRRESVLHFAFEGDMFGIFDIGGPQAGRLEVIVDGELVKLKHIFEDGSDYFLANDAEGEYYLDRFSSWCEGRYRGQYVLVKVPQGSHQVTLRISSSNQDEPDKSTICLGRILLRGKPVEVKRIKGIPKLKQQLKWDTKLERYARQDADNPPKDGVILFVGSSTIENWKTLSQDFPDKYVLNRGVSGTKTIDMINYLEHLVTPYSPSQIFLYPGDNDIGYKWTPDEIMEQVKKLFTLVRAEKPDAEIVFISIKPCPRRMKDIDKIVRTNEMLKAFALSQENTAFADVFGAMLSEDGTLVPEYYRDDALHLTEKGYEVWKKVISEYIR